MDIVFFEHDGGDDELPATRCLGAKIGVPVAGVAVVIVCKVGRINWHGCAVYGCRHPRGDYI